MKNILVPTDFSSQAENALKVAAQLAKNHGCDIYLLHMLELPLHKVDAISSYNDLPEAMYFMKLAHKQFEELMTKDYLEDIKLHEAIEFKEVFKGVFHACQKFEIDLIVMGSHGASGLKEMIIGSNAEKVVRTSNTPVLIIKKEYEQFEINHFVFASDFKIENQIAYTNAVKFAKLFNAKIHLLIINTASSFMTTKDAKSRIMDFVKIFDFKNYSINIYNDESVERGIMNFSQSINADLIGMSTHGRQGISHFFNGSISEDLVNHAKRPVITFKI
jgi:nucleotide-binding universal stress UspA family protein